MTSYSDDGDRGSDQFSVDNVRAKLEELHAQGAIDLDAPARRLVDVAEQRLRDARERSADFDRSSDAYWLVGSKGWFSHIQDEVQR